MIESKRKLRPMQLACRIIERRLENVGNKQIA